MSYYVPDGNWTNNVVSSLGNNAVDVLNYVPNLDSTGDPARGCAKNFTSTYKCGLGTTAKNVSVDAEAGGKTARFDCSAEFAKCSDLKLTLTDDGKLTLTNTDGTKVLWDSITAFGANGAFPANSTPIVDPMNAGNGTADSRVDVGAGGGPGRRYKHNYLLAGQYLEAGQWIGSPTGTCRLMMGTTTAPNSLQVVKNVQNCDELDTNATPLSITTTKPAAIPYTDLGCWRDSDDRALTGPPKEYGHTVATCGALAKARGSTIFALQNGTAGYGGWCVTNNTGDNYQKHGRSPGTCPAQGGPWINHVFQVNPDETTTVNGNTDAARLYTIPFIYNENVGKAGYVNELGQLQLYPDTMTSYGNKFDQIGNYSSAGGVISSFGGSTLADCQSKCLNGSFSNGSNDTQKCAGFVFDTTGAMCKIMDKTLGQQQRILSPTASYYARQKGIVKQDISCPADVTIQTADFWNSTEKVSDMSTTSKCGLAKYVQNERAKVASDLPDVMNNVKYKDANNNLSEAIKYVDVSGNPVLLNKNKNGFKFWFEKLQDKYNTLTVNLFSTKASIKSKMDELEASKQDLADWTGEQLQNLQAMSEDRDLNMMSQNYRHILWSILAIIIIIGTLKITKTTAAA